MADLALLTAAEQVRLIRAGKASPVEVMEATLARIRSLNQRLNAFITLVEDEAMLAARLAQRAIWRGQPVGPLVGVPVALKDNFETKGVRTTAGSRVLEDNVPDRDATAVQRLRQAGAIIVGKTHLSEFASAPSVFGEMRNPWDLNRLAGASSGGSGAAVGARLCPLALGTDAGGSVRMPGAFSGVVGLKPTHGRVSRHGVIGFYWSRDNVGSLTRTAEDAALALSAIAGYDPQDPDTSKAKVPNYARGLRGGIEGLRIGLPREWFFDLVDPQIEQAVREGVRVLKSLGASTREVSVPMVSHCREIADPILRAEAATIHQEQIEQHRDKYGPYLWKWLQSGRFVMATDYLRAQRLRRMLRHEFVQALSAVDVLITPTMAILPPLLSDFQYEGKYFIKGKTVGLGYALSAFTTPFNLTGQPALSVPCGFSREGLPIGMQIAGRAFDEATILRVAHAFQQHTEWHMQKPAL